jgi:hypothetical protein
LPGAENGLALFSATGERRWSPALASIFTGARYVLGRIPVRGKRLMRSSREPIMVKLTMNISKLTTNLL